MKFYLAGKIGPDDWRQPLVKGLTEECRRWTDAADAGYPAGWSVLKESLPGGHDYVGPYFIADGAIAGHGGGSDEHGPQTHGCGLIDGESDFDALQNIARNWHAQSHAAVVHSLCHAGVSACDCLFAWIEDTTAFGSLYEIGIAAGLGKDIYIAGPRRLPDLWLSCESALRVNFRHPTPSLAWEALFPPDYKTMPYDQYLQTAHWQATRQGALTRAKFACQICNAKERLHVHHRTYARRGEELPEDLTVLCADCHGLFHERRQVVKVAANGKPAAVKAVVKR